MPTKLILVVLHFKAHHQSRLNHSHNKWRCKRPFNESNRLFFFCIRSLVYLVEIDNSGRVNAKEILVKYFGDETLTKKEDMNATNDSIKGAINSNIGKIKAVKFKSFCDFWAACKRDQVLISSDAETLSSSHISFPS
jgi:hypothetical protein